MKKILSMILALTMMFALVACGGKDEAVEAPDLATYYTEFEATLGADNTPATMDLDAEMQEAMYPGISEYTFVQSVFKAAMMMQVGYEFALVECESAEDAEAVAALFQARKDAQVAGGAFYPAVAESWENGEIITKGNVVALIVANTAQEDAVSAFNALFA